MHRALFVLLILALPFVAVGQDVVKVNILELAGKIPTPPRDVKDAFSRTVEVKQDGGMTTHREAEPFYKPVSDQLQATNQKLEKAVEVLSKPQIDAAKQIDEKELQKKFKSMSREEQMKMAMEMSKTMGYGHKVIVPESKDVMAAQEECQAISMAIGQDSQTFQATAQAREKISQDRDAKHDEVKVWQETEVSKLPQINYGEMSGPEPKAEYAVLTKAMDKHLAVENDYLRAMQKEWRTAWDKYNARFGPLQEKLARIHYGEDAKNPETRRQLLTGQSQMLSSSGDLMGLSQTATESAAAWWQRKLDLENNKPKK